MDLPTKLIISGLAFQHIFALSTLGRLVGTKFWDAPYNLSKLQLPDSDDDDGDATVDPLLPAVVELTSTYYSARRFVFLLPHVFGALVWWNLYYVQLIPSVRQRFRSFHKYLGRVLLITAIIMVLSGCGMASTSHSNVIAIVSYFLAVSVLYCIYQSWRFAKAKDYAKHKYWSFRLIGYLQTIALQRVWMVILIGTHAAGCFWLYPSFDGQSQSEITQTIMDAFDHSFIVCFLQALISTEWYLSTQYDPVPKQAPLSNKKLA